MRFCDLLESEKENIMLPDLAKYQEFVTPEDCPDGRYTEQRRRIGLVEGSMLSIETVEWKHLAKKYCGGSYCRLKLVGRPSFDLTDRMRKGEVRIFRYSNMLQLEAMVSQFGNDVLKHYTLSFSQQRTPVPQLLGPYLEEFLSMLKVGTISG